MAHPNSANAPSFRDTRLRVDPESRDSGFDATHRPGMTSTRRKLPLDKRRDKTRHRRRKVTRSMHQMNSGKFRLALPGKIGLDPRAQRLARHIDIQYPDHRDRSTGNHA